MGGDAGLETCVRKGAHNPIKYGYYPGESPHIAPRAHHTLPHTRLVRRRLLEDDGNTRLVGIRRLEKRGKEVGAICPL